MRNIFILALLLNSIVALSQEYNFNPRNRDLRLLKRNNFDPFYEGQNFKVNEHLELAFRKNKIANGWLMATGALSLIPQLSIFTLPGIGIGYVIKLQSRKQIRIASLLHITSLSDQTYSGTESFRQKERVRWYEKKNFYAKYYNGLNPEINQSLDLAWDLKKKANLELFYATASGTVGGTLLLISFINFLINTFSGGNAPVLVPFAAGAILTGTGTFLFIKGERRKNKVELNLWNATESWYSELHGNSSEE